MLRFLLLFVVFSYLAGVSLGQTKESDTRVTAIELIGRDLVRLLNQLTEGERDPTKRLPVSPVLDKATKAVESSPTFQQAQSNKKSLEGQRKEARAGLLPQISLGTGSGKRDYDASASTGGYTRYSGDYTTRSLSAKQLLYDFGGAWSSMTAAEKRLMATELKVQAQRSEIFLQALKIFYETQRGLLQVRLARENLQARRAFVNFIRSEEHTSELQSH